MLRSEIPFPTTRWPGRLLATLLGESFLGLLAILATALTIFPMLFPLGEQGNALVETAQWFIIAWFSVEYLVALICAPLKSAFLRNPWRLIDLLTILIPLATLLPSVSNALRSSPILRLVRLIRLVTLGVRASGIIVRSRVISTAATDASAPIRIERLNTSATDARAKPEPDTLPALLRWLENPSDGWYHVTNPSTNDLAAISQALRAPANVLETQLTGATYPHLLKVGGFSGLFTWLPDTSSERRIQRQGILVLAKDRSLLSLASGSSLPMENLGLSPSGPDRESTPPLAALIESIAQRHERLIGLSEDELRALEELPVRESRPEFFERTFRLKKDLSTAQADLWRLKGVVAELGQTRSSPSPSAIRDNTAESDVDIFQRLAARMDYLYETVINIREGVLSLIDLHLNIVSFDMNRVMRVLAVVSVLGLVPAVVGGLFGMNLIDNPWPFTLPQVAFSICLVMVVSLYGFFVKGWLR